MSSFQAEDLSRFFIREFLKKNEFDRAYKAFLEEDKRPAPGGTMNRPKLVELLGLGALQRANTKTKQYTNMLDIVMGYLVKMREALGGVTLPAADKAAGQVSSSQFYGGEIGKKGSAAK